MLVTRGIPRNRDPRTSVNRFAVFAVPFVWILRPERHDGGPERDRLLHRADPRAGRRPDRQELPLARPGARAVRGLRAGRRDGRADRRARQRARGPRLQPLRRPRWHRRTPAAGVLEGVTRGTAIELLRRRGVPVELRDVHADELRGADEAFATSHRRRRHADRQRRRPRARPRRRSRTACSTTTGPRTTTPRGRRRCAARSWNGRRRDRARRHRRLCPLAVPARPQAASWPRTRPDELGGQVVARWSSAAASTRGAIEDVTVGCAFPEGEQGMNVGRICRRAGRPAAQRRRRHRQPLLRLVDAGHPHRRRCDRDGHGRRVRLRGAPSRCRGCR